MTGLLTARAVAEMLEVNPETVLRWVRRGELPAHRLPGGAIRFKEDDLERWIKLRATGSAPPPATLVATRPATRGGEPR